MSEVPTTEAADSAVAASEDVPTADASPSEDAPTTADAASEDAPTPTASAETATSTAAVATKKKRRSTYVPKGKKTDVSTLPSLEKPKPTEAFKLCLEDADCKDDVLVGIVKALLLLGNHPATAADLAKFITDYSLSFHGKKPTEEDVKDAVKAHCERQDKKKRRRYVDLIGALVRSKKKTAEKAGEGQEEGPKENAEDATKKVPADKCAIPRYQLFFPGLPNPTTFFSFDTWDLPAPEKVLTAIGEPINPIPEVPRPVESIASIAASLVGSRKRKRNTNFQPSPLKPQKRKATDEIAKPKPKRQKKVKQATTVLKPQKGSKANGGPLQEILVQEEEGSVADTETPVPEGMEAEKETTTKPVPPSQELGKLTANTRTTAATNSTTPAPESIFGDDASTLPSSSPKQPRISTQQKRDSYSDLTRDTPSRPDLAPLPNRRYYFQDRPCSANALLGFPRCSACLERPKGDACQFIRFRALPFNGRGDFDYLPAFVWGDAAAFAKANPAKPPVVTGRPPVLVPAMGLFSFGSVTPRATSKKGSQRGSPSGSRTPTSAVIGRGSLALSAAPAAATSSRRGISVMSKMFDSNSPLTEFTESDITSDDEDDGTYDDNRLPYLCVMPTEIDKAASVALSGGSRTPLASATRRPASIIGSDRPSASPRSALAPVMARSVPKTHPPVAVPAYAPVVLLPFQEPPKEAGEESSPPLPASPTVLQEAPMTGSVANRAAWAAKGLGVHAPIARRASQSENVTQVVETGISAVAAPEWLLTSASDNTARVAEAVTETASRPPSSCSTVYYSVMPSPMPAPVEEPVAWHPASSTSWGRIPQPAGYVPQAMVAPPPQLHAGGIGSLQAPPGTFAVFLPGAPSQETLEQLSKEAEALSAMTMLQGATTAAATAAAAVAALAPFPQAAVAGHQPPSFTYVPVMGQYSLGATPVLAAPVPVPVAPVAVAAVQGFPHAHLPAMKEAVGSGQAAGPVHAHHHHAAHLMSGFRAAAAGLQTNEVPSPVDSGFEMDRQSMPPVPGLGMVGV
ncbi:hypothetical protein HDU96_006064 [Phlyctochytrium bullatum]|nr:hypothetical protein HDU96_006064 [Phlyctochytrium bullatum]